MDLLKLENNDVIVDLNIMILPEFKALFEKGRNICNEDTSGEFSLLAIKELKYLYLRYSRNCPYYEDAPSMKKSQALHDTGLSESFLECSVFKAAEERYLRILNSDAIVSLIESALGTAHKMKSFLDTIDFHETDEKGRLVHDFGKHIDALGKIVGNINKLQELKNMLRKASSGDIGMQVSGDHKLGVNEL